MAWLPSDNDRLTELLHDEQRCRRSSRSHSLVMAYLYRKPEDMALEPQELAARIQEALESTDPMWKGTLLQPGFSSETIDAYVQGVRRFLAV